MYYKIPDKSSDTNSVKRNKIIPSSYKKKKREKQNIWRKPLPHHPLNKSGMPTSEY